MYLQSNIVSLWGITFLTSLSYWTNISSVEMHENPMPDLKPTKSWKVSKPLTQDWYDSISFVLQDDLLGKNWLKLRKKKLNI